MLLTRMIQVGSVLKYERLIKPELFGTTNREIYLALQEYERTYGVCIDEPTFRQRFDFFTWSPSEREVQVEFFIDDLSERQLQSAVTKELTDAAAVIGDDPKRVSVELIARLHEINRQYRVEEKATEFSFSSVQKTIEWYLNNQLIVKGLTGVTLGFDMLDGLTHGTQPGEIEIWAARTGNCKTFLLLLSAYRAFLQGKRVTFVSPEMPALDITIRMNAIMFQNSQSKVWSGLATDEMREAWAEAVINAHLEGDDGGRFIFRDAFALGRRFNINDIARMIETDKSDIVVVDGLVLIDPSKPYRNTYECVTSFMAEVRQLTIATNVPFRLAHQINRKALENRSGKRKREQTTADQIPELEHLAESGATEQFANRVICCQYDEDVGRMYLAMRKNRNGKRGKIMYSNVDIDVGAFSPLVEYSDGDDGAQMDFDEAEATF